MGGIFGKDPPKPPPPPPPVALPEVGPDTGDAAARAAQRRSGFQRTILTGALEPEPRKKTTLG
jgi:hypothetical protein